jgi:thioredoxin reductase
MNVDAAVVGAGPAGLTAALWLGRYRRRTVMFDSGEYRNANVHETHGYFGSDAVDPGELRRRGLCDLHRYETVSTKRDRVIAARAIEDGFVLTSESGDECSARSVVLATGVLDRLPEIANVSRYFGSSVFQCPSCDGYEVRGKRVVVIGDDRASGVLCEHLLEWAASVTVSSDVVEIVGDDAELTAVRLADGSTVEADVAFLTADPIPRSELGVQLHCRTDVNGCVCVDDTGMTDVDGVFAAGDIVPGPDLVQVAAATGAIAGINCALWLADG